jgi:ubiquinone/menaquinone biosynthesis C-methylase UbiE
MSNVEAWDRAADKFVAEFDAPIDAVSYGEDMPDDRELRLVGRVQSKRVLDLGCGAGHNAVALALQGATVTAVDGSDAMLEHARRLANETGVKVEFRASDLAELAWLRADSIDIALSIDALVELEDLDRALRSVHRVLRTGAPFVFTYSHPMALVCRPDDAPDGELPFGRLEVQRSYFEMEPMRIERFGEIFTLYPRTFADIFSALGRAGFGVDILAEPQREQSADPRPEVPRVIAVRARKQGN